MNPARPPGLISGMPADDQGPVFDAPWQAHAFALAVRLHESGVFTWAEWAAALGAEIARAREAGDPDLGDTYYHHWLAALQRLVTEKGVLTPERLAQRHQAWALAAAATPHGKPIELPAEERGIID